MSATWEVPAAVADFCESLVEPLQALLGPLLSALYLFGSAVIGDFDPVRSDVDLLLVVATRLGAPTKSGLIRLLWEAAPRAPGRGMEFSVVTEEMAASGGTNTEYELMVITDPLDPFTQDGVTDPEGYSIVVLDMARMRSTTMAGPPSLDLIAEIPKTLVARSMRGNLERFAVDTHESYSVLTAARSFVYLETNEYVSKKEAGNLMLARDPKSDVLARALEAHAGLVPERSLTKQGRHFIDKALRALANEAPPRPASWD